MTLFDDTRQAVPYVELSDKQKEMDRGLVKTVYAAIQALE